ncbi:type IV secretory system conjugative DNA transfer family protein [Pseudotenacibaculum haliotis]|uniref:Type IV secretory system conjugative DNA transfer family protein n=1 Tax=Pseudotenacibaculum haliotis TaxID=1862138 RepID=A0ABW5LM34_9FLAO
MIKLLIDTLSDMAKEGSEFALDAISGFGKKEKLLSAKFGKESSLLSKRNEGLSLTGTKFLSIQKSKEHVMFFGPSGSGKTTVCLIPSAIRIGSSKTDSSMIINNPSGENEKLEAFLVSKGYTVLKFNPNDKGRSIYYNPLARIKSSTDVMKIAEMLVVKGSKKSKDFWQIKSVELISLMIEFLLGHASKVHQNIANVYYLLQNLAGDEDTINRLFADKATEKQWHAYKAVIANSENTKASIISSAISALSFVGNSPELCDVTSVDNFDFSRLKSEKICLFLNIKTMDMQFYSPILGLFFEQLFSELMNDIPNPTDNPLFLLIDELSSIPLPSLPVVIANARKYFSILGILQSESQLSENYGEHSTKTILNNACKVYMSGLDTECERISKALGEYQYYEDKEKKILRTRKLMTAQELRTMSRDRVIILPNGGLLPLYCKATPFYKNRRYLRYMEMELPEDYESGFQLEYTAQYLPLDKYKTQKDGDKK